MAILTIDYSSAALRRRTQFTAVLPVDSLKPDYSDYKDHEFKTFKTLYLLHGYSGDCTDWLTHCNTKNWATKYNCAVIMPSGENSMYVDHPADKAMYGEMIGKEIVEISRKMFPLSHKREDTFLAGLSMGGFGTLSNGIKYRDTFSYIASLSGGNRSFMYPETVKDGNLPNAFGDIEKAINSDMNPTFVLENLKKEGRLNEVPKIWISCGSKDGGYEHNKEYRDYLMSLGLDVTWDELPLAHEWAFWSDQLEKLGSWLPLGGDAENLSRLDK